ncbi:MAG: AAA family ATPase, partial [Bacteroidota bacterium]|nr:AAA family ATPase [Bacteroidota bacterium]
MAQKQIYIITGGPGFGKTELINVLRQSGYLCSGEFARELIDLQQKIDGDLLPCKKPKLFQEEMLTQVAFSL